MGTENWERLGQVIRARRKALGLAQVDVTAAGGPSDETLRRLEHGEPGPYMRRTLAALERVLKWSPGAVKGVLAGDDPAGWELPAVASSSPAPISARDRAVTALLDYADELENQRKAEVLAFVRRLMTLPGVNA